MAKTWTDAEFVVVRGGLRVGDPHPRQPRWRYAGVGTFGRALWYRPPRLNRWQLFAVLCAAILVLRVVVALVDVGLHQVRPY